MAEPIQTSFAFGELAERGRGRFDSPIYKAALDRCENFAPTLQGSLLMRGGTQPVDTLEAQNRIIPFRVNDFKDYIVELGNSYLRIYSQDTGLLNIFSGSGGGGGGTEILLDGNLSSLAGGGRGGFGAPGGSYSDGNWNLVALGDMSFQDPVVTSFPSSATTRPPGTYSGNPTPGVISLTAGASATSDAAAVTADGNALLSFTLYANSLDAHLKVKVGTTPGGSDLLNTTAIGDTTPADFNGFSDTKAVSYGFAISGAVIGNVYVQFSVNNIDLKGWQITNISLQEFGASPLPSGFSQFPTPWSSDQVPNIQYVIDPSINRMILVHPNGRPQVLTYQSDTNWSFQDSVFTRIEWTGGGGSKVVTEVDPSDWADNNWPSSVEIHQGRLYLGGVPSQRNTLFASRPGDLFDFTFEDSQTATSGVTADCAINETISTKGGIKWIKAKIKMLLGTGVGPYSVSSQGAAITPLDIGIFPESAFGSSANQAQDCGDEVLYVSQDLRKTRALSYEFQRNAWVTNDITFSGEHLTVPGIREIHFAPDPVPTIVAVLNDGTLACCSYERSSNGTTTGWYRITFNNATVFSAAIASGPNGSIVYLSITRQGITYLERLPLSELYTNFGYMDAQKKYTPNGADGSVSGIPYSVTVRVKDLNGAFVGDFTPAAGVIQLGDNFKTGGEQDGPVSIGIPYTATATTLPRDVKTGRAHSPKVGIVLNDSALPKINGKLPPDRKPSDALGALPARTTGKITIGNKGWSPEDKITITQDASYRTEILALYSTTEADGT